MAELVGLVSAIAALAGASLKIARAISNARDDFGAAASSIKAIADDMRFVTTILRQIHTRVNGGSTRLDGETAKLLDDIVARCKADVGDIEQSLLPLIDNINSAEPISRRKRLRWLFAKSKICSQQATLASLKLTLTLFISTLQLADGFTVDELKEEILDAIAKTTDTKAKFLYAERIDQTGSMVYDGGDQEEDMCSPDSCGADEESPGLRNGSTSQVTLVSPGSIQSRDAAGYFHDSLASLQLQTPSQSDMDVIQSISDDCFIKMAAHMSLQKSVTSFALVEIHRPPAETPEAAEAPQPATPMRQSAAERGHGDTGDDVESTASAISDGDNSQAPSQTRPGKTERSDSNLDSRTPSRTRDADSWRRTYDYNPFIIREPRPSTVADQPPSPPRRSGSPPRPLPWLDSDEPLVYGSYDGVPVSRQYSGSRNNGYNPSYGPGQPYSPFGGNSNGVPLPDDKYDGANAFADMDMGGGHIHYDAAQFSPPYIPNTYRAQEPPERNIDRNDPEVARIKRQEFQLEQERLRELQEQIRPKIGQEIDGDFRQRMEMMQRAQEEAQREIVRAKAEAEQAARQRVQDERKEEEMRREEEEELRRRELENARKEAEREMRITRLEAQVRAAQEDLEAARLQDDSRGRKVVEVLKKPSLGKRLLAKANRIKYWGYDPDDLLF